MDMNVGILVPRSQQDIPLYNSIALQPASDKILWKSSFITCQYQIIIPSPLPKPSFPFLQKKQTKSYPSDLNNYFVLLAVVVIRDINLAEATIDPVMSWSLSPRKLQWGKDLKRLSLFDGTSLPRNRSFTGVSRYPEPKPWVSLINLGVRWDSVPFNFWWNIHVFFDIFHPVQHQHLKKRYFLKNRSEDRIEVSVVFFGENLYIYIYTPNVFHTSPRKTVLPQRKVVFQA